MTPTRSLSGVFLCPERIAWAMAAVCLDNYAASQNHPGKHRRLTASSSRSAPRCRWIWRTSGMICEAWKPTVCGSLGAEAVPRRSLRTPAGAETPCPWKSIARLPTRADECRLSACLHSRLVKASPPAQGWMTEHFPSLCDGISLPELLPKKSKIVEKGIPCILCIPCKPCIPFAGFGLSQSGLAVASPLLAKTLPELLEHFPAVPGGE